MIDKGWIKLHRSIIDNPMFVRDKTAMYVFLTLLLLVDRNTGVYKGGRFKLAAASGVKPFTCYRVLKRLRDATMLQLKVNPKYTEITVVNWSKYQNGATEVQSKGNRSAIEKNTIQEVISKKENKKTSSFGNPDINEIIRHWEDTTALPITSLRQRNRNHAATLLKRHTLTEVKQLINGAAKANMDQFAGKAKCANLIELQMNESQLIIWGRQQTAVTPQGVKL